MFSLIATIDKYNNLDMYDYIPWLGAKNLGFFKDKIKNAIVIMGHNTWKSLLRKPMPDHINIVLSTSLVENNMEADVCVDELEYRENAQNNDEWVIRNTNPDFIFKSIDDLIVWFNSKEIYEKYKNLNKFVIGGYSVFHQFLYRHLITCCYITHINIVYAKTPKSCIYTYESGKKSMFLSMLSLSDLNDLVTSSIILDKEIPKKEIPKKLDMNYINDKATPNTLYEFLCDDISVKIVRYFMICEIGKYDI